MTETKKAKVKYNNIERVVEIIAMTDEWVVFLRAGKSRPVVHHLSKIEFLRVYK